MKIKDYENYDVAVIGGGPSGIMAARAISEDKKIKVVLIEKGGSLGGANTRGLVMPMMTFHAGKKQIIKGYAEEFLDKVIKLGGSVGHIIDPLGVGPTVTPVDTETYKYVAQQMLLEKNVKILYHTELLDVEKYDKSIKSVIVKTKSGLYRIKAKLFIDATGDAEVAFLSGCTTKTGREDDGKCQPMTMMFRVGNVDVNKVIEYSLENPEEFIINSELPTLESATRIAVSGFFTEVKEATSKGDFSVERDRVLFFELSRRGEVSINMSRVVNKIATKDFELSEASTEGRKQVFEIYNMLRNYIPGFEKSYIIQTAEEIGIRESRRLVGNYTLTEYDIVNGRMFSDNVALGSWPIDIHDPEGKSLDCVSLDYGKYYGIPYRCLVTNLAINLIVTGRAISCTHEALASTRVSPICMALGQAAGVIARVSICSNVPVDKIDIEVLKVELRKSNQLIE